MASCKDCVHVEVCCEKNLHVAVGMNIIPRFKYKRIEQECKNFKDRSRFVELDPCEGGEIITLEGAIAHCYEVADGKANACEECRAEHMMLGAWLRELKLRREQEMQKPLGIGDTVHFVLRELDEIDLKEYKFTVGKSAVSDTVQFITEIGTYGFWVGESPREFAPDYDEFYHWYELGETVFLTREEAEQALKLKEREGGA